VKNALPTATLEALGNVVFFFLKKALLSAAMQTLGKGDGFTECYDQCTQQSMFPGF
jgi:hypothetical protein